MLHNKKIKKIAIIALAFLLIAYIAFQFIYTKVETVQTETAIKTTASDEYQTQGYVFRDEVLIENNSSGVVSYSIEDGASVANGETIGSVYPTEDDVNAQVQIEKLQKELKSLQDLEEGKTDMQMSLNTLNDQIYLSILGLTSAKNQETYLKKEDDKEKLLNMLNERKILTGTPMNFTSKINDLNDQINKLKSSHSASKDTIKSPVAGNFISYVSGYENAYDYNKIKQITPAEVANGFKPQEKKSNVIGKIDKNLIWYVVCNISADNLSNFSLGDYVSISMPFATTNAFNAKIAAINRDESNQAAVVFACNTMNSDLAKANVEQVKIKSSEHTGVRINKNAIHINTLTKDIKDANGNVVKQTKDVQGVYILYGKQLLFKQIVPICSYDNYVLCKEDPDENELFTDGSVQVYDKVVVKGTNLYAGKFVR